MIDTSPYHVLFADNFAYRHGQLKILAGTTGRNVNHCQVHVVSELEKALMERVWDVVMVAGYFDKHDAIKTLTKFFCGLSEAKRPRLVLFHGTTDEQNFVRQLRNVGYLASHIPWDFLEPSKHKRNDPENYFSTAVQQVSYTAQGA